jgi:hypothetical protein
VAPGFLERDRSGSNAESCEPLVAGRVSFAKTLCSSGFTAVERVLRGVAERDVRSEPRNGALREEGGHVTPTLDIATPRSDEPGSRYRNLPRLHDLRDARTRQPAVVDR